MATLLYSSLKICYKVTCIPKAKGIQVTTFELIYGDSLDIEYILKQYDYEHQIFLFILIYDNHIKVHDSQKKSMYCR